MIEAFSADAFSALLQVVLIDLVLAGDNAIVIGLAASGLPSEQRTKAILLGIGAATALRILFAGVATWLLAMIGLMLAGGILLLWVCWKMWRELRGVRAEEHRAGEVLADARTNGAVPAATGASQKTLAAAAWQIIAADVSMSLDNVLAVAGAAREHPLVLVFGLLLSIALMGVAASFIARLLHRHRWIAYVGLAIILYVALKMVFDGAVEVREAVAFGPFLPGWVWGTLRPDLLSELWAAEAASTGELADARLPSRRLQHQAEG